MSEYQRYEFMTKDRPLTRAELEAVNTLSSHIDASSTHALIEYHWGDFKYTPLAVLHKYFDGYLYWANWGAPELALRFPHGIVPADFLDDYDLEEFVTFTRHPDYDILDLHFGGLEGPDEWVDYRKRARKPSFFSRGMHGRSFPEAGRTGWVSTPGARLVLDSAGGLLYN